MQEKEYDNLRTWFLKYTDSFLDYPEADIENILLKKEHTLRVCQEMELISKELSPEDKILALTVALLHDVGRFDQLRIYRTFSDFKSEDHASLGVKILKELDLLKDLDPVDVELIFFAVENHNKPEIVPDCSFQTETITKLLRDADKLDIWHVVIDYYKVGGEYDNPSLVHNLPFGDDVCASVFQAIEKRDIISYDLLETVVDIKIFKWAGFIILTPGKLLSWPQKDLILKVYLIPCRKLNVLPKFIIICRRILWRNIKYKQRRWISTISATNCLGGKRILPKYFAPWQDSFCALTL
ncbi:HD domain-containing protein [Desulfotalea psychrophila]|uniref:HD domain-containing protein n=1 Tax=Desulfotalea psychrophila TaxID=84980 RepID=UPI00138A1967|nr:HD domain-containing protein [Desulfotalea psychrophila]